MTHPETPEVGGEPVDARTDALNTFEALAESFHEEEEPEEPQEQAPEATDDEPDIEAEDDDLPPIDAPVSWDAEAKAKFAELPRDTQEYLAKREGERERFVQQKSQEAARARTETQQAALQQLAEIENGYAQHFEQLAGQLLPQRPNPTLLQQDPMAFYAAQANYENAVAQQRELQQQADQFRQQAQHREAQAQQAYHAEQHNKIVTEFPEYADPTTGPKLRDELSGIAKYLGYPPELIAQARADDILAMRKVAELKAKADKYDGLMAKKMEKVRAAKGLPKVATPGVSQGADQLRATRAQAAWEATKTSKGQARDEAFAAYLQSTGQL